MLVFTKPEEELRCLSLVMKVIYVLHVAKDDMLLVGDAWRNLLHTVGHLPQVGLTDRQIQTYMKHISFYFFFYAAHIRRLILTSRHSWRSLTYVFSVCSSSAIMNLRQDNSYEQTPQARTKQDVKWVSVIQELTPSSVQTSSFLH